MTLCFVAATFVAAFSIEPVQAQWSLYQKNRVVKQDKDAIEATEMTDKEREQNEKREQAEKNKRANQRRDKRGKGEPEKDKNSNNKSKEESANQKKSIWEGLRKREKQKIADEEAEVGEKNNSSVMSPKRIIPILRLGSSRTDNNKDISIVTESMIR
ncbi:hypothetical protein F5884DRAFT_764724 [Xylogone sp. PMI_703]|nr:hypothetical protein F5884DRAFT_764724 [Xylogone sp. PMI_703]